MPKSKCPTKWKVVHPTKAAAQAHAKDLRRKGARSQEAYQCPEGHWHVGSGKVKRHARSMKGNKTKGRRRR